MTLSIVSWLAILIASLPLLHVLLAQLLEVNVMHAICFSVMLSNFVVWKAVKSAGEQPTVGTYTPLQVMLLHKLLSLLSCFCLQLLKRVAAAESAAQSGLQQAAAHYQQQLEQLAASHTARIDALRGELAADASRRADTEGKIHVSMLSCWFCCWSSSWGCCSERMASGQGSLCPGSVPNGPAIRVRVLSVETLPAPCLLSLNGLQPSMITNRQL